MRRRRRILSAITSALVVSVMSFSFLAISAHADEGQSLDEVINGNSSSVSQDVGTADGGNTAGAAQGGEQGVVDFGNVGADLGGGSGGSISDELKDATNLDEAQAGATKINQGIKKIASFIIQILSYALTVLLTLRVLLDLIYINVSFSRGLLGGGAQPAPGQPGMGGMGSMGGGRYGMGGMGSMGMSGGMGMNGMAGQQGMMNQQGAGIRFVSDAAINAISQPSPMRFYAKDMMITLIIVPVLIILAVTGVLADLGFLIGEAIAKMIGGLGGMI